jgi:hypothetical protein
VKFHNIEKVLTYLGIVRRIAFYLVSVVYMIKSFWENQKLIFSKTFTKPKLNSSITSSLEPHYQISWIPVKQFGSCNVRSGRRVCTASSLWVHFTQILEIMHENWRNWKNMSSPSEFPLSSNSLFHSILETNIQRVSYIVHVQVEESQIKWIIQWGGLCAVYTYTSMLGLDCNRKLRLSFCQSDAVDKQLKPTSTLSSRVNDTLTKSRLLRL